MIATTGLALAQDVRFNFDAQADFAKFKTYKWVDIKSAQQPDDLTDRQIRDTIEAELGKKGLTKTDADSADLFIGYQTAVNTEKEINSFDSGWGYGPGWRYGGMGGMSTSTTSTLYVGSLALDMYDSSKKQLVWRGTATKTLDTKAKPEKRQKNLQKGAAKLLKNYPPKQS
ncbi:MAG TPA: DUF4136 domain-containing protein [Bryobacteraceae bacterium]|nr:DUF4136 domain-containing protein [Bryobacteraceae bacterium]